MSETTKITSDPTQNGVAAPDAELSEEDLEEVRGGTAVHGGTSVEGGIAEGRHQNLKPL